MLASQPAASPMGVVLVAAAVYPIATSPAKLKTLLRAVGAAAIMMAVIAVAVYVLGFPRVWLRVGGLLAETVAVIAAWWHVRGLKRAAAA